MAPLKQRSPTRLLGSLALRVLIICIILIIIPLLIHTLFMYRSEYRSKLGDAFISLNFLGREKVMLLQEVIHSKDTELNAIEILSDLNKQSQETLNQKFKNIASQNKLSSIFYLKLLSNGTYNCIYSSNEKMIGQTQFFNIYIDETIKRGSFVFAAVNPINHIKEFYTSKAVSDDTFSGALFIGMPMHQLLTQIAPLKDPPYSYRLSLITPEGSVFSAGKAEVSLDQVLLFSFSSSRNQMLQQIEQFKSQIGWWAFFARKNDRIGIKFPVEGTDLTLVLDVAEKDFLAISSITVWKNLSSLLLLILILGGLGAIFLILRIAKPLKRLNHVMQAVGHGNLNARYPHDPMGFEINVLGTHFNEMVESLSKHIEKAKNERIQKEVFEQELMIGHEIQKTILPSKMPAFPGVSMASGFVSAKEVGGDFYDVFVKDPTQLMLAIADAEGKGISACLYSLCVRSMLRSFEMSQTSLSQIIQSTNSLFYKDAQIRETFVTAWIANYHSLTKTLEYSSCGHPPAILRRKEGAFEELHTKGMALGVSLFDHVETARITLNSEDLLILYTDGLTEAHDAQFRSFGKKRLLEAIEEKVHEDTSEIVKHILQKVASFSEGINQHDDITLLVLKIQ